MRWLLTFIFYVSMRDSRSPVACATWQARRGRGTFMCPYVACNSSNHHTFLTADDPFGGRHTATFGQRPEALPPATGATSSRWATRIEVRRPALASHVLRAARAHDRTYAEPAPTCPWQAKCGSPEQAISALASLTTSWRRSGDDRRRPAHVAGGARVAGSWCGEGVQGSCGCAFLLFLHTTLLLVRLCAVMCSPPL